MRPQPGALVAMAVAIGWFPQLEGRARREGKEVGTSDMVRAPGDPQVLLATTVRPLTWPPRSCADRHN